MRVAILNVTRGAFSGGYGKYLQEVVPRMARHAAVESVVVFNHPDFTGHIDLNGSSPRPWPTAAWHDIADVIFIPNARWVRTGLPTVVMVRNMEPLTDPFGSNPLREGLLNLARAEVARRACRRATRVVAVSRFVADHLTRRWQIPAERIGVVYHGVDAGAEAVPIAGVPAGPFVFTGGSIRPSRGLEDLIHALARLEGVTPVNAVIAGSVTGDAENYRRDLNALAARAGVLHRLHWVGQLDKQEMAWCYRQCAAFVMTSRVEACPNMALEALAYNAIPIAARNPPLPEFFEEAGLYYAPRDSGALASRIEVVLNLLQPETIRRRQQSADRGRTFTWQATVDQTVAQLSLATQSVSA